MKNPDLMQEVSVNGNQFKKLAEKIAFNLESVNLVFKDIRRESNMNSRLGVIIDWSKGTFVLESNRR